MDKSIVGLDLSELKRGEFLSFSILDSITKQ